MKCKKCGKEIEKELELEGIDLCEDHYWEIIADKIEGNRERYVEKVCEYCGDGGCVHCEPSRFI